MFSFLIPAPGGVGMPGGATLGDARMAAEDAVIPVEQRLQALELACAGLWSLLQTKHGYTNDELIAAIHEVDARDGVVDGKIGHVSRVCPNCHRKPLTRASAKCSWCGCALGASPL